MGVRRPFAPWVPGGAAFRHRDDSGLVTATLAVRQGVELVEVSIEDATLLTVVFRVKEGVADG